MKEKKSYGNVDRHQMDLISCKEFELNLRFHWTVQFISIEVSQSFSGSNLNVLHFSRITSEKTIEAPKSQLSTTTCSS